MSEGFCWVCVLGRVTYRFQMAWWRCDGCGITWTDEQLSLSGPLR